MAFEATSSVSSPPPAFGGRPIRLAAGAHSSPEDGVCVVELASVIAAERFSDRPRCVCPVIGAFLRGWNDRAPHAERQRLRPYAELIVGSRAGPRVTRERRDVCLEWAQAVLADGPDRPLGRAGIRVRIAVLCGLRAAVRFNEGAGDYASRVAWARRDTASAFELLDTLLAIGRPPPADAPPVAVGVDVNGDGNGHRNGNGNGNGRPPALGPVSRGAKSPPERPPERSESEEPSRART